MHSISLIVATKDRPEDLRRLLESLRRQTERPDEIVVVDASRESVEPVINEFRDLTIRYLRHWPPSAAAQRNAGIRACNAASTLIGFADDDTTFEPQAFENMMRFWASAGSDVLGAAFNIRNYPDRGRGFMKYSALAAWLGLYSSRPGSVALSGWQTIIGELTETQFADWLPSGAATFREKVFVDNIFDEFFESYSYLEDLDFSYSVSRKGRLAVVADAGYSHYPSRGGRISAKVFGLYEVRNRLYFVRKHGLSLTRCCLCLAIRWTMTVMAGLRHCDPDFFRRACGNVYGLMSRASSRSKNTVLTTSVR
jgi:GT2 family glycosyltransferase